MGARLSEANQDFPDGPVVNSISQPVRRAPGIRQRIADFLYKLSDRLEGKEDATPDSPPHEAVAQRQRQRQSQRGGPGGLEDEARVAALPQEELVRIWREDILPNFDDRIK